MQSFFLTLLYRHQYICSYSLSGLCLVFFKQKTAYEWRISDLSSDVRSSDLDFVARVAEAFTHDGFACNGATDPATYRGGDRREERDLEQVHLLLGFDGVGYLDDDYYVLSALSTLFGGGMSSRLFQEVREKRGLDYSVYAFHSAFVELGRAHV